VKGPTPELVDPITVVDPPDTVLPETPLATGAGGGDTVTVTGAERLVVGPAPVTVYEKEAVPEYPSVGVKVIAPFAWLTVAEPCAAGGCVNAYVNGPVPSTEPPAIVTGWGPTVLPESGGATGRKFSVTVTGKLVDP
jgi:hypothetical protein